MAIQGNLHSLSLPDLVSLLHQLRRTGVLSLVSALDERAIVFYEGNILYATTRDFDRRLGTFLVRLGAVGENQVTDEAEDMTTSEELYFGARLLETGKIEPEQLMGAVRAQVLDILKEVLSWEDGVFLFDDAPSTLELPQHGSISSQEVILEAARLRDEDAFASEVFDDRTTVLSKAADIEIEDRGPEVDDVLDLVDGVRTIGEVLLESRHGAQKTSVILKGLLETGGVVEGAAPGVAALEDRRKSEISFPVAPTVPGKLFFTLTQDEISHETVCSVLAGEPMLTAKILKMLTVTNTEIRRSEMSIESLVELSGDSQTRSLLLPESVRGLHYPTHSCYWHELWSHSRVCADVCEFVASQVGYPFPGEAYLAGLLHDMGAFVLLARDPELYRAVVRESLENGRDIEDLEKGVFGVSHTELGSEYAEKWNFPRLLFRTIRDHHKVEASVNNPLLHIVSVANGLAQASGYRVGHQSTLGMQFEDSLARLKLDQDQARALYSHVMKKSGKRTPKTTVVESQD